MPAPRAVSMALADARREARPMSLDLASWLPPDLDAAYRLQRDVATELGAIGAWKVSALTPQAQRAAGVAGPIAAPLPARWVLASPARLALGQFLDPLLECEFAFELSHDLPARDAPYTRAEVEAAIGALRIAIEVCDSRLPAASPIHAQLADGFNNGALIVGPAYARWRGVDYAKHAIRLCFDDGTGARELAAGNGQPILDGDPVGALVLMANLEPQHHGGLRSGQSVTTGTCTGAVPIPGPGVIVADFGSLGEVRLRCDLEIRRCVS